MKACARGVMEPVRAGERSEVVGDWPGVTAANESVGMLLVGGWSGNSGSSGMACSLESCKQRKRTGR